MIKDKLQIIKNQILLLKIEFHVNIDLIITVSFIWI